MAYLSNKDLQRIFESLDRNCDGCLCLEDLNGHLTLFDFNCSRDELESSVGKASLDFYEFLNFYETISKKTSEEEEDYYYQDSGLVKAFKVFDRNGDGLITSEDARSVLLKQGLWESGGDCNSMIRDYDMNVDGQLDFQEFKNMMLLIIS